MTDWTEEADAAWLAAASAMTTPLRREAMVAALKAAHKRGIVDGLMAFADMCAKDAHTKPIADGIRAAYAKQPSREKPE